MPRVALAQLLDQVERLLRQPAGVDREDADLGVDLGAPCRAARRRRPGTRWRARSAARTARAPTRAPPRGSSPSNSTASSPASSSSISSTLMQPPPSRSCLRGLAARPARPARRRSAGARTRGSPRPVAASVEPAADEALDRRRRARSVGHAAEERPADRGVRAEPAAHEDVVRLPPLAGLVAGGRALEAEVADPVLGAGVRAAVEVQPQAGDASPKRSSRPLRAARRGASSSRSPRSCSAARRCTRSSAARRRLASSGKPISASARGRPVDARASARWRGRGSAGA